MSAIKLLAAVYMLLVAAAVAVNFIASLFYDPPIGRRVVRLLLFVRL